MQNGCNFLYQIAKHYVSDYDGDLGKVCFVFPSRRSSLYFRKWLGLCSSKPIFSPELLTISDLFDKLSPFKRADKIELVSILYKHYLELGAQSGLVCDSFDEFVYKADTLLSDFNDIDQYLVDARDLFANIRDLESISSSYEYLSPAQKEAIRNFWKITLDNSGEKPGKARFLQIWNILWPLYDAFKADLASRGIAYEGMITRAVAELVRNHDDSVDEALAGYDRIVFVGHNALSACEEILFSYINNSGKGDFYWDFKGKLVRDKDNKASSFISRYESKYPSVYQLEDKADEYPQVEVVSVPSAIGQAKKTADYLKDMDPDSTAIVLPDESLLLPLLNSIPESIEKINVTMGYGLSNSAFAALMSSLSPLQQNKRSRGGQATFYHKDVTAILSHPFILNACGDTVKEIQTRINLNNLIQVPAALFEESQQELLTAIFRPVDSVSDAYGWQLHIIELLAGSISDMEKEFAYGYYKAISHIRDLDIPYLDKLETYFHFLRQMTARLNVPFRGEPLHGLQVMGPLETRALDFENVIILSVNEGTFPARNNTDSYIPYSLRKGFGLPSFELFDSISAYHFYRSIYRARKVVLMYDSRTFGVHSGEPSRFIMQLKHHYKAVPLVEKVCTYTINPAEQGTAAVVKDAEVMEQLRKVYVEERHSFSASSLNDYMSCPLKFYYTKVKGIKESDKVDEGFESGPFGTAFHSVMETLYGQHKNEIISREIIGGMLAAKNALDALIAAKLDEAFKYNGLPLTGKRRVTFEMLKKIVLKTLEYDMEYAPFTYLDGERKIVADLDVNGVRVNLIGFIDRLDSKAGQVRIVDYKTGSIKLHGTRDKEDVIIDKLFDVNLGDKRPYSSFQMYLYAYLMARYKTGTLFSGGLGAAPAGDMDICVYQMKQIFDTSLRTFSCNDSMLRAFEDRLKGLIVEILSEGSFEARPAGPSDNKCDYCPVRVLCSY
ncbi:MAG: PD-(D/E)XK nuclease family protein [Bacteroidales bacterium]|nr:PD-(D/E)XK nuclease family protein [Bacteroidales bacterium]